MSGKRAFTLIELLLVVLLMGTVITVIMACFEGGFRVYARVSTFGGGEAEVSLAGEIIERDLRNVLDIESAPFRGDENSMEFAAVVYGTVGEGVPARIRYRMEEGAGILRTVAMLNPSGGGEAGAEVGEWWLAGTYRLSLSYRGHGGSEEGSPVTAPVTFVDLWPEGTNAPAAVRIGISGGRLEESPIMRTVGVGPPGGGRLP